MSGKIFGFTSATADPQKQQNASRQAFPNWSLGMRRETRKNVIGRKYSTDAWGYATSARHPSETWFFPVRRLGRREVWEEAES